MSRIRFNFFTTKINTSPDSLFMELNKIDLTTLKKLKLLQQDIEALNSTILKWQKDNSDKSIQSANVNTEIKNTFQLWGNKQVEYLKEANKVTSILDGIYNTFLKKIPVGDRDTYRELIVMDPLVSETKDVHNEIFTDAIEVMRFKNQLQTLQPNYNDEDEELRLNILNYIMTSYIESEKSFENDKNFFKNFFHVKLICGNFQSEYKEAFISEFVGKVLTENKNLRNSELPLGDRADKMDEFTKMVNGTFDFVQAIFALRNDAHSESFLITKLEETVILTVSSFNNNEDVMLPEVFKTLWDTVLNLINHHPGDEALKKIIVENTLEKNSISLAASLCLKNNINNIDLQKKYKI